MTAQPWMKFYPNDWASDDKLAACSYGAQGIWIRLIGVMYKADPVGHLVIGGKPLTMRQIANLCRGQVEDVEPLVKELIDNGVCDVIDGVIVSRRMVREEARRQADKINGRRGGNPELVRVGGEAVAKHEVRKAREAEKKRRQRARRSVDKPADVPPRVPLNVPPLSPGQRGTRPRDKQAEKGDVSPLHVPPVPPATPRATTAEQGVNPPDKPGVSPQILRYSDIKTLPSALNPRDARSALEAAFGGAGGPPCHPMGGGPPQPTQAKPPDRPQAQPPPPAPSPAATRPGPTAADLRNRLAERAERRAATH